MHRKAGEFGRWADLEEYGKNVEIAQCAGFATFLDDEYGNVFFWGIFIRDDPRKGIVLPHELVHLEQVLAGRGDWRVRL